MYALASFKTRMLLIIVGLLLLFFASCSFDSKNRTKVTRETSGVAVLLIDFDHPDTTVKTFSIRARLYDTPSMQHPDTIKQGGGTIPFAKDLSFKMDPYSVLVAEVGE